MKGQWVEKPSALHPVNLETLWVGSEGGMEAELVKRAGLPYRSIPAAGVHGVSLRELPRNLSQLTRGVVASRRILRGFRPDVLFFTGGYVAVPMAIAGQRIPTLLYVPDIEPGLALKALSRFADRITVTAPDSQRYFNKNVIVTGYPLRQDLSELGASKRPHRAGTFNPQTHAVDLWGQPGRAFTQQSCAGNLA